MMLSKTDFEEVFPHLFKPNNALLARDPTGVSGQACIARWEDDGGAIRPRLPRPEASAR